MNLNFAILSYTDHSICFRLILSYEEQHIVLHSTGSDYDEFKDSFNG